ncbi:MAG: BadF/BadG/BcrA/BcrD ATPase family protein [Maritimibacter sp.]
MQQNPNTNLIAVDGGGSTCRFALSRDGARIELQRGPANVTTDFDAAISTLREGLAQLAEMAGLPMSALHASYGYLGLAGVVDATVGRQVATALGYENFTVEYDRRSAVVGALGAGDGTVIGIGTGSFLARQQGGEITLLGGWGFPLGDEASGADLGRGLLRRILHGIDGLAAPTALTNDVLAELGGSAADIVAFASGGTPTDFARLAPKVVAAATAGDAAGRALMDEGAAYIMRAAGSLGWVPGEPLCLIGGLAPHYAPFLPQTAADSLVERKGTALDGALELAARRVKSETR